MPAVKHVVAHGLEHRLGISDRPSHISGVMAIRTWLRARKSYAPRLAVRNGVESSSVVVWIVLAPEQPR